MADLPQGVADLSFELKTTTKRGTTNRNERGSTTTRRARRKWLLETYAADVQVIRVTPVVGDVFMVYPTDAGIQALWVKYHTEAGHTVEVLPTARCYRCGTLLIEETVTCDRIVAGTHGGEYGTPTRDRREKRTNVRPACADCNTSTGGKLGAARLKTKREAKP